MITKISAYDDEFLPTRRIPQNISFLKKHLPELGSAISEIDKKHSYYVLSLIDLANLDDALIEINKGVATISEINAKLQGTVSTVITDEVELDEGREHIFKYPNNPEFEIIIDEMPNYYAIYLEWVTKDYRVRIGEMLKYLPSTGRRLTHTEVFDLFSDRMGKENLTDSKVWDDILNYDWACFDYGGSCFVGRLVQMWED